MYRCARNSKAVLSSSESPPMLPLPEATRGKSHQVPSGSSGGPWRPSTGRRPGMDRAVSPLPADCFHLVFVSPEATAVSEELGSDASPAPSVRIHGARHARKVCHCRPPPCAHQEEERVMRHVVTFILTQPGKSQLSLGFANVNLHNWWTQEAGSSLITAASHYETEVLRTRCGSGFTLISRPLWAESGRIWYFTSHPAVKLSTLRIPGRLSVWFSQNHMLSWVDFLNFLPAVKSSTVYMQICCEDDDGDTTVNGWTSMKPARTHRAAKSVTSSFMHGEWARTDSEVRQTFHRVVAGGKRKGGFVQRGIVFCPAWSHMKAPQWLRFNEGSHSVIAAAEEEEETESTQKLNLLYSSSHSSSRDSWTNMIVNVSEGQKFSVVGEAFVHLIRSWISPCFSTSSAAHSRLYSGWLIHIKTEPTEFPLLTKWICVPPSWDLRHRSAAAFCL